MAEEMKDWQNGIALEELKQHAAIFKTVHGQHVYGAFGLIKEREVAEAIPEGRMAQHADPITGKIGAALLYRRLKSSSTRHSYYERPINLLAGESIIYAFAVTNEEQGCKLLAYVTERLALPEEKPEQLGNLFAAPEQPEPRSVWIEIFEEDSLAKKLVLEAGYTYVDTVILAGSEIKGLYIKGRHVPAACDKAEFATLSILDPFFLNDTERASIIAELSAYGAWADHYSSYNKKHSWTAIALRGYCPEDPGFIIQPAEMSKKWKAENAALLANKCVDTVLAEKFPVTMAVAARIPGEKDRVRFMKLAPGGGELTRHADTNPDAGVADGRRSRLHIPIVTNPGVIFTQWNSRGAKVQKNFPEGALCYLDQRQPHQALNGGETERIHLVMDVASNDRLRALIANGE